MEENWLQVIDVKDKDKVQILNRDLDIGESEAIALALQTNVEWLLLDEREARNIGKSIGLRVTGVLGIILKAWKNGALFSLKDVLEELIDKAGFRISNSLYKKILAEQRVNEN